jgi:hypothetical protein
MQNNQGPKQKKQKIEFPQAKMGKDIKKKVTEYVESYIAKKVEQYTDENDVKDIPKKEILNPIIEVDDGYGIKIKKNGQPCPEDVDNYLNKKGGSEAVSREEFVRKWADLVDSHIKGEEAQQANIDEMNRSKGTKKLKVSKTCNEVPIKKTKSKPKSKSKSALAKKMKRPVKKNKTKSKTRSKSSSGKPKKVGKK